MALSNLDKKAEHIEGEIMDAFIDDGGSLVSMGHLQDVTINLSAVTQDADTKGRQKQIAVDVEISLVMQQTTAEEFSAVSDAAQVSGKGTTIKCTSEPTSASNADSADGYEFVNVWPNVEGEFDGSGEGSMFTVSASGRVLVDEIADPSTFAFDK